MNILQLTLHCAPNWVHGGVPRIMYDYTNGLAELGHKITIITPDENMPRATSDWCGFHDNVEVKYIKKYNNRLASIYYDFSFKEIMEHIKKERENIDVIYLTNSRSIFHLVALVASYRWGIPLAISSFGSLPSRGGKGKAIYDHFFTYPMIKRAKLLLGQTDNELKVYSEFGGSQEAIKLLPLAVKNSDREEHCVTEAQRIEFLTQFGVKEGSRVFMFLGRLHPTKGVPELVSSFLDANGTKSNAVLLLVGNDEGVGDSVAKIIKEKEAESSVILCGPIYGNERWLAYHSCDVYVINPNVFEETPLAALEALSCSKPVITNNKASIPWLDEYGAGVTVDSSNAEQLNITLERFINMPISELDEYKCNAENLFFDKFEVDNVCKALEEYLAVLVKND